MSPLPNLQQSKLDPATLDALFADLAGCAEVLSVVPRTSSRGAVAERPIALQTARAAIREGSLRGVQIRYRFEGAEWCDTLMTLPGGAARLVRLCADEAVALLGSPPAGK